MEMEGGRGGERLDTLSPSVAKQLNFHSSARCRLWRDEKLILFPHLHQRRLVPSLLSLLNSHAYIIANINFI